MQNEYVCYVDLASISHIDVFDNIFRRCMNIEVMVGVIVWRNIVALIFLCPNPLITFGDILGCWVKLELSLVPCFRIVIYNMHSSFYI